eukprot:jgi/Bigna1/73807/fgenesh1_pg.26_\
MKTLNRPFAFETDERKGVPPKPNKPPSSLQVAFLKHSKDIGFDFMSVHQSSGFVSLVRHRKLKVMPTDKAVADKSAVKTKDEDAGESFLSTGEYMGTALSSRENSLDFGATKYAFAVIRYNSEDSVYYVNRMLLCEPAEVIFEDIVPEEKGIVQKLTLRNISNKALRLKIVYPKVKNSPSRQVGHFMWSF